MTSFVGIPYRKEGRTLDGVDCWGIVMLVTAALGRPLPDFFPTTQDAAVTEQCGLPSDEWIKQRFGDWQKTETPQPGDVVVFKNVDGAATHVGVMVGPMHFLQCTSKTGVIRSRIDRFPWSEKIAGVYAYHGS